LPSEATYFVNIDITPLGEPDDVEFALRLVNRFGVAGIPVSAFYPSGNVHNVIRFCFAKNDETLDKALSRLANVPVE